MAAKTEPCPECGGEAEVTGRASLATLAEDRGLWRVERRCAACGWSESVVEGE